jgi:hypothetical protein
LCQCNNDYDGNPYVQDGCKGSFHSDMYGSLVPPYIVDQFTDVHVFISCLQVAATNHSKVSNQCCNFKISCLDYCGAISYSLIITRFWSPLLMSPHDANI